MPNPILFGQLTKNPIYNFCSKWYQNYQTNCQKKHD
uniref:Uncharacterized protein n=1 Tax=Podoviridae sp. ctG4L18 TaxID=2825234 RepID=A0A8S5UNP9_9CAUD|nr:MAG TPA: hypothetical protein [Podoviridae sp. ctG4L18]